MSPKAQHTPGPWKRKGYDVAGPDGGHLFTVYPPADPTREEADNARADAAHAVACVNAIPEIEAIAARLETGYADPSVGGGSHNEGVIAASRAIAVQIRAALAKAVKP